jgi:hypothetical protein
LRPNTEGLETWVNKLEADSRKYDVEITQEVRHSGLLDRIVAALPGVGFNAC